MKRRICVRQALALLLALLLALPMSALAEGIVGESVDPVVEEQGEVALEGEEVFYLGMEGVAEAPRNNVVPEGEYSLISGNCVRFYIGEYDDTVESAALNDTVNVTIDETALPDGKYFTGEFVSEDVTITENGGEYAFTMPGGAVTVSAVLADRVNLDIDLTGSDPVPLPDNLAGNLTEIESICDPEALGQVLLNGDTYVDAELDLDNNTIQRCPGADDMTDDVTLNMQLLINDPTFKYGLISFRVITRTVTVTVNDAAMGTASASPASGICGKEVTLTATPNSGYRLKEWQVVSGGVTVKDDRFTIPSANVEVKAIFEAIPITTHTLTIHYVKDGNTPAADDHVETLAEGATYNVESPVIEGYTPDVAKVDGTMGTKDVTVTVTYISNSAPKHTLTIHYVKDGNTPAADDHVETLAEGATYSVESPVIEGYTPDKAKVDGKMGTENVTVTVIYTQNTAPTHTLTIKYVYADNTKAKDDYTAAVAEGASYAVASPTIAGYTPDVATVSGTMGTENVTVTVTYAQNKHALTIHYVYADKSKAKDDHVETLAEGAAYSVESPAIEGYTPDKATVSGTMGTKDVTETVTYKQNKHTLTIHYVYADKSKAKDDHVETLAEGATYAVTSPTIDGFAPDKAKVEGTMGKEDVTVTVTYTRNPTPTHALTIQYVYADGTQAAPTYAAAVAEGASYSVDSPAITGFAPDHAVVAGTMGTIDLSATVTYSQIRHTLTIQYVYADGTQAAPTYANTFAEGESYAVPSPVIAGFAPNYQTVAGTMSSTDMTATVTYIRLCTLTIQYVYADGTQALATYSQTIAEGVAYSVESPALAGFTPSVPTVAGTMGAVDVSVTVTYARITYTLTIQYVYADGTQAAPTYANTFAEGESYAVPSPVIEGFMPDDDSVDGTMGAVDVSVTVTYIPIPVATTDLFIITYDKNKGSGSMGIQAVSKGVKTKLSANQFKRKGYYFTGWNTKKNGSGTAYKDGEKVTLSNDVTLYAQWAKYRKVSLYMGSSTIPKDLKKQYKGIKPTNKKAGKTFTQYIRPGVETALIMNPFANTRFHFTGWNTQRNGSGTAYRDGEKITLPESGSDLKLYAQWEINDEYREVYWTQFNANGGSGTQYAQSCDEKGNITLKPNLFTPTVAGMVFDGWNTKKNGSGTSYKDGAKITGITSNLTLYAQWKPIYTMDAIVKPLNLKSVKTFKLTTKLKYGKKGVKGETVTLTFNGQTYTDQTSSTGTASFHFKKDYAKNLEAGKRYPYSFSHDGKVMATGVLIFM